MANRNPIVTISQLELPFVRHAWLISGTVTHTWPISRSIHCSMMVQYCNLPSPLEANILQMLLSLCLLLLVFLLKNTYFQVLCRNLFEILAVGFAAFYHTHRQVHFAMIIIFCFVLRLRQISRQFPSEKS